MMSFIGAAFRSLLAPARVPSPGDDDGWDVRPVPSRVVAIGDLHGDVRAFGALGHACRLMNRSGTWTGGDAHLVLMGDLVGGDWRSRLLLNAVMRLEREAEAAGGRVHALLGNHDILPVAGRFSKMRRAERDLYERHTIPDASSCDLEDAFRGDSVYARWMRCRRVLLKIGDSLFVHAGVDRWALDIEPAALNAAVTAWIAHWQGVGPRPPRGSRWTIKAMGAHAGGPLWTRAFKARGRKGRRAPGAPSRKTVDAVLLRYGAARVIVGHSPTNDGDILLEHPHYGDAVVLIDTRISDKRRGRMSALELRGEVRTPIYVEDREAGAFLEEAELGALDGTRPRLSAPAGLPAARTGWLDRIVAFFRR